MYSLVNETSLIAQLVRICLQFGRPGFEPWLVKIPWRRERLPTPLFLPGEFQRLYSPWGCKSRTRLNNFNFHFYCKWYRESLMAGELSVMTETDLKKKAMRTNSRRTFMIERLRIVTQC